MRLIAIVFVILFLWLKAAAQQDTTELPLDIIENLVERIAQSQELDNYQDVYEDLVNFYQNKINLNQATYQQLANLHFLTNDQINAILDYKRTRKQFISIYELQMIPQITPEVFNYLSLFVTVKKVEQNPKLNFSSIAKYGRHQIFLRDQFILQPQLGYILPDSIENRYLGNRHKLYLRYKYKYRDLLEAGFTAEKDAGEPMFEYEQKAGFDFYSAHLQVSKLSKHLYRLNLGDYQAQFGQGLVLWQGFAVSKSAYVLNIQRIPYGIRRYTSADENRFLRGLAATFKWQNLYFTVFGSYKNIDANLQFDSLNNSVVFTSFLNSGYHRTPNEMIDRHSVKEKVGGFDLTYLGNQLRLGVTAIGYQWNLPFQQAYYVYRLNPLYIDKFFNIGANWFYWNKDFSFFGELGVDQLRHTATVVGVNIFLNYRLQTAILYRYFSPQYFALYSNAFAESSTVQNEQGFYLGFKFLPYKHWQVSAYFDFYSFPWMRYRLYSPKSFGNDIFAQIDFSPSRKISMYVRLRYELKPQNISTDTLPNFPLTVNTVKKSFRYNLNFKLNNQLRLKTRIELKSYAKDTIETGFLVFQDIKYSFNRFPLTFYLRFAFFDAPYNARIYAYENDLLYVFSVPAYFYQGYKFYVLIKYQLNQHIAFWLKYSNLTYTDRQVISPGNLNEIQGNMKSEFKIQMRIKF